MENTHHLKTTVLVVLLLFCSCAPPYNLPGGRRTSSGMPPVREDSQTLVFATFSGGGTRAAAMGWRALEILKNTPYVYRDTKGIEVVSNLADEIDYVSGISGGSFAAAGWCLYKKDMDAFRKSFIRRNVQAELMGRIFIPPWRGLRLLSPYFDRIHIAAEFHDQEVFGGKTFGDLPPRPLLWIHATHLALGKRFTFTQPYFDLIGSDLSNYPIGHACAASSAFPILLSPMTLINYGEPVALKEDIRYRMARMNARDNIEKDQYCRLREFFNDKTNRYMHLADGGLVDNQGLQSIIDEFDTNGIINKRLNDSDNPLRRLIIININAGVSPDDESCKSHSAPPMSSVIEYTMTTSMDDLSAKRWMKIKELCQEIYKAKLDIGKENRALTLLEEPYTIEINFRNAKNDAERAACLRLPTSFHLSDEQLDLIDKVVPGLVRDDPDMIRLAEAIKIKKER